MVIVVEDSNSRRIPSVFTDAAAGKASPPSLADFPPPGAATATGAPVSTLAVAGFRLEDADGSVERTEAMVGEIVGGWGGILKSTPPAKLLSRPPVRCDGGR